MKIILLVHVVGALNKEGDLNPDMTDTSSTVSLDWLKAVWGGHRGVLTRLTNELNGLLSLAPDEAKDKVGRLKISNQQLQNKLTIKKKMMIIYWRFVISMK